MPRVALPKDYERKLGRPHAVDISTHMKMCDDNPDEWIAEDYTDSQATSARRQFKTLGYEVMTSKSQIPGHRVVLVRVPQW